MRILVFLQNWSSETIKRRLLPTSIQRRLKSVNEAVCIYKHMDKEAKWKWELEIRERRWISLAMHTGFERENIVQNVHRIQIPSKESNPGRRKRCAERIERGIFDKKNTEVEGDPSPNVVSVSIVNMDRKTSTADAVAGSLPWARHPPFPPRLYGVAAAGEVAGAEEDVARVEETVDGVVVDGGASVWFAYCTSSGVAEAGDAVAAAVADAGVIVEMAADHIGSFPCCWSRAAR